MTNGVTYYYSASAVNSAGESGLSSQVSATPAPPSGSVTISGTIQYQDKEYGANGFTGNQPYKAVRYAAVDLVSRSTSTVLCSALTDSNGFYSFTTAPASTAFYIRVEAEATLSGSTPQIMVKSLGNYIYSVAGSDFTPSGSAVANISVPATSIAGAFNILDVFTSGLQFVNSLSGTYPDVPLYGYWQKGNSNGTYYCSSISDCNNGEGIYVLNTSSDTDEYDDDVLYHEFGHFIVAHYSKDNSPGGPHTLTDNDLDMRLSWSEGWGDSMPGNIKMWLYSSSPNLLSSAPGLSLTEYIDTTSSGAGIAIDMDHPDGTYSSYYFYACGEVAVAKIMLDTNKHFGMQTVWDVVSSYGTSTPAGPVNLESFWDRWHSLGELTTSPFTSVTIDSIFANRQVNYSPDSFEPADNNPASASTYTVNLTGPQQHTFYQSGDVDYVAFNAQQGASYTIRTSDLKNGADTYITLLDSDQTTTTATPGNPNDNANGAAYSGTIVPSDVNPSLCDSWYVCHDNGQDILGSYLSFTPASGGIYYLKIQSSPTRPVSAGKYGSYILTITQQ